MSGDITRKPPFFVTKYWTESTILPSWAGEMNMLKEYPTVANYFKKNVNSLLIIEAIVHNFV